MGLKISGKPRRSSLWRRQVRRPSACELLTHTSQLHSHRGHIKGQRRRSRHRRSAKDSMPVPSTSRSIPSSPPRRVAQIVKSLGRKVLWDYTIRPESSCARSLRSVRREFEERRKTRHGAGSLIRSSPIESKSPRFIARGGYECPGQASRQINSCAARAYWAAAPGSCMASSTRTVLRESLPPPISLCDPRLRSQDSAYEAMGFRRSGLRAIFARNRVVPEKNDLNSLRFLRLPRRVEQGGHARLRARRLQTAA